MYFIKIKVNLSQACVILGNWGYPVEDFALLAFKHFKIIWLSNLLTTSVPDECYSRNASCTLNYISTFFFFFFLFFLFYCCLVTMID